MPIAIANDIDLPFGWDFDSPTSAAFESKLKLAYLVARAANERFFLAKQLPTGNCRFHEKKKYPINVCKRFSQFRSPMQSNFDFTPCAHF